MRALHAKRQQTSQAGENPLMRINGQFTTLLNLGLVIRDPPLISFTILRVYPSVQL